MPHDIVVHRACAELAPDFYLLTYERVVTHSYALSIMSSLNLKGKVLIHLLLEAAVCGTFVNSMSRILNFLGFSQRYKVF